MKQWYRFRNQDDPAVAEIQIVDFIGDWIDDFFGFGVTAKQFVDELSKLPEAVQTIRVHINSPGGDVFGAVNIANALREQRASKGRKVETIVDGLAASAASIVLMAGDPVRIADNALVMIHNPWTIAGGNAAELRKGADTLDSIRDTIIATYQWHAELSDEELVALMDAETWMDADEAIERGFANEKIEGLQAAAAIDPRVMAKLKLKVPEQYEDRVKAWLAEPAAPPAPAAPEPERAPTPAAEATEVLRLCREGECLDLAEGLIAAAATRTDVEARISAERAQREQAAAREREIRAVCEAAQLAELADEYVAGGMPVERVRAQLTVITARLDKAEVDTGLSPNAGASREPVIDVRAIYAELNGLQSKKE